MALIQCPDCGSEVSDAAPTCPKCGRPIAPPAPVTVNVAPPAPQKPVKPAKKNSGCAPVILVAIIAFVVWAASRDDAPKPGSSTSASSAASRPAEAPKPVFATTAMQLFQDYDRNEVAADEAMKGHIVRVKGRIQAIDKDFTDDVIVNLQTPNEFMPARMQMIDEEKSAAAGLSKGQTVEVECERMSRVVGSPSGRKCHFVR